jgi:DNA-binding GntR family transcriptional regulator
MRNSDNAEPTQSEIAYGQLYDAIQTGVFRPGDRVRETDLATRFSLSRTPVRDALRRLEADGIIEHRPRIGAVVRSLTHGEIVELYEMRLVLERTAAQMAAKHANPAEIGELSELNSALQEADDPQSASKINQHFHRCIYMSGRNRFLMETSRALNNALMLLGPTTLDDETRISTVVAQHQDIIDAIDAGDEDAASGAAGAHLQTSLRHRLRSMRQ